MHKGRLIFTSQGMSDHQLVLRAVKLESLKGAIRQLLFDSQKQGETFRSKTSMFKQSIHRNDSDRSTGDKDNTENNLSSLSPSHLSSRDNSNNNYNVSSKNINNMYAD